MPFNSVAFLRRILVVDAITSGSSALILLLIGGSVADRLGLPPSLVQSVAIALVPFSIFVALLARQERVAPAAVWTVIVLNGAWVIASIWLATSSIVPRNALGNAVIVVQALMVGVLGELQYVGLRRLRARPTVMAATDRST
jgi:hypothetical protein